MNKKSFVLAIKMLTTNYKTNLDLKNEQDKQHVNLLFSVLETKGFTDEDVLNAVLEMITKEDSLFGKELPPLAWFFTYSSKHKDPEKQAELEAERIIDTASYPCPVIFDNGFTNAALQAYGGIGKVYFDVHDSFNRDRKSRNWVKKELKEIWLSCHTNGTTSNKPSYPAISSKNDHIDLVGDKVKCQALLDSSQKLLDEPKNEEMDKVIGKLEGGWKIKAIS